MTDLPSTPPQDLGTRASGVSVAMRASRQSAGSVNGQSLGCPPKSYVMRGARSGLRLSNAAGSREITVMAAAGTVEGAV